MTAVKGTANICLKMGKKCPLSKLITLALYKVKREKKKQCQVQVEGTKYRRLHNYNKRHTEHIWELRKRKSDNQQKPDGVRKPT